MDNFPRAAQGGETSTKHSRCAEETRIQFSAGEAPGNWRTNTRQNGDTGKGTPEISGGDLFGFVLLARPWSRAALYTRKVRQGEGKQRPADTELQVK